MYEYNTWNTVNGRPYSRKDPGVWLVYLYSTRRGARATFIIGLLNQWLNRVLGWKFEPTIGTHFGYNINFLAFGSDKGILKGLKKSLVRGLKVLYAKNMISSTSFSLWHGGPPHEPWVIDSIFLIFWLLWSFYMKYILR